MWISDGLLALAMLLLLAGCPLSIRHRIRLGVLAVGFLSWASFGLLALALVCFDLCLERLTVMSQKRRQQKAFRAYWPWLVDLMRIAISGGAAHGVAFDHALTALKHSPLNAFGQRVFARRDEGQDRIGAICSVAREMESREALDLGLAMRESAKQGSDLSPLLIEQARALRERTQRRLEQAANGLSVKLLIPLVICFFPMFFIVLAFTIFHSLGRLPWSS